MPAVERASGSRRAAGRPLGDASTARQLAELEKSADRLEELGRSIEESRERVDRFDRQIEELEGSAERLAHLSLPRSTNQERATEQSRRVAELEDSANRLDGLERSARVAAAGGGPESRRSRAASARARRTAELKQSERRLADLERSASRPDGEAEAVAKATTGRPTLRNAAPSTVVASADDPDAAGIRTPQAVPDGRPARSIAKPSAVKPTMAKPAAAEREKIDASKAADAVNAAGRTAPKTGAADASSVVTARPAGDTAQAAGDARSAGSDPAAEISRSGTEETAGRDRSEAGGLEPNARLSAYQVEVAELLAAGAAARRKRRTTTASGLPAPDPATQEPPIKLTRPARPGPARPQARD
jgi:hypothetical protein